MRLLRTLVSAVLILVGASLIALWAVSGVVVSAVEDGTAMNAIAERALEDPAVVDSLGDAMGDAAVDSLAGAGVDLDRVGLEAVLRALLGRVAESEEFRREALAQVDAARAQLAAELTDDARPPAPLVLEFDASGLANDRIDDIPLVGESLPDVALAPVPVEVVDAQTFETARDIYGVMEIAERWALWAGIALVVLGLAITTRTRWFLAKLGVAVAAITAGLWLALEIWGVDGIAAVLPGGADGAAAGALTRIVTEETAVLLQERLLTVAAVGAGVAVVAALIAAALRPRE